MKKVNSNINKLCQDLGAHSKYLLFELVFFSTFGFVVFLMLLSGIDIDNVSFYFLVGGSVFSSLLVVLTTNKSTENVERAKS